MPTNLPPQYFEVEKRYRSAQTPQEKIEALEDMLAIMPKHKGTDKLRADLRTRIARAHEEAQKKPVIGKKGSLLYHVVKEGAGQLALVGLTNAGKSQLVAALTEASPEVADYPFTTQTPLPAMWKYENIQIQLIDIPALNAPQVDSWLPNIIRNADLLLIVVDLTQDPLNQMKTIIERLVKFRVIIPGIVVDTEPAPRMASKRAILLGNKCDEDGSEENWLVLGSQYKENMPMIRISAVFEEGLEELGKSVYQALGIMRVYTQVPGRKADLNDPTVIKKGSTVQEVAEYVHKDFRSQLNTPRCGARGNSTGRGLKGIMSSTRGI